MGLVEDILGGDKSYSSSTVNTPPSSLIPQPDLSQIKDKRLQKRLMQRWLEANERVTIYNNMDRIVDAIAFTALFLGQCGVYSQLDIFKYTTKTKEIVEIDIWGKPYTRTVPAERKPDWMKITGASGIVTAFSYMARNNPNGFAIPAASVMGLMALEGIGDMFQLW